MTLPAFSEVRKSRLFGQMSIVFAGGFLRSIFGVLQGIIIAKYLGAESFGKFAYAMALVGLVFGLADFRIQQAVIKFTADLRQTSGQAQAYALSAFFFVLEGAKGVIGYLIIIAAASAFFGSLTNIDQDMTGLVVVIGLYQLFITFNPTLTAWLRLGERFRTIANYDGIFGFVQLLATATAAIRVGTVESVALAYALVGLFGGVSKFIIVVLSFRNHLKQLRSTTWLTCDVFKRLPWQSIWRFLLGVNVASSLRLIARQADVLILAMFIPMEGVGTYSLAKKLKNVFSLVTDPLLTVIYPEYAKQFAKRSYVRLNRLFRRMTKAALVAAAVGGASAALIAPYVLPPIFGEEYHASVLLFQVLIVDAVLLAGMFSAGPMALALSKPRFLVTCAGIQLGVIVSAGMVLSPVIGALGMTASIVLSTMAGQFYLYASVTREMRTHMNEQAPGE